MNVWPYRLPGYKAGAREAGTEGIVMLTTRTRADEARGFRPSRSCAYEGWTVAELKKRAKQLGISGYSGLNKERLISLIRSY